MRSTIFCGTTNSPLATVEGTPEEALAFYAEQAGHDAELIEGVYAVAVED
jgi:hypothetical protein